MLAQSLAFNSSASLLLDLKLINPIYVSTVGLLKYYCSVLNLSQNPDTSYVST